MEKDVIAFVNRMEAMYERLGSLYTQTDLCVAPDSSLLPTALKELSLAAEELQVASEELHQQNEQLTSHVDVASTEAQHYYTLFDCAAPAQLVTTAKGKILEANQAAAALLSIAQSLLTDRLLISFVPLNLR
jgi:PAS domain-containing protein